MSAEAVYQGWSGWIVRVPGETTLVFDPSPDVDLAVAPNEEATIFITHGHPEHYQGAVRYLTRGDRKSAVIVASRSVCGFLKKNSLVAKNPAAEKDRYIAVKPGVSIESQGWKIDVFGWKHMGLLPPGVAPKLRYLRKLAAKPRTLMQIARDGVTGPLHQPMLGFRVHPTHGGRKKGSRSETLVYLGEGLHRQTRAEVLCAAMGRAPDGSMSGDSEGNRTLLIAGIEPEDLEAIPRLVTSAGFQRALFFEPHRPWRDHFGLPTAVLAQLAQTLAQSRVQVDSAQPGDKLTI